jgi:hypothetical protein
MGSRCFTMYLFPSGFFVFCFFLILNLKKLVGAWGGGRNCLANFDQLSHDLH